MKSIVVGIDGSPHSRKALRRAVAEAAARGCGVEALYVIPPPTRTLSDDLIGLPYGRAVASGTISPDAPAHHPPSRSEESFATAEAALAEFVEEATQDVDGPTPRLVVVPDAHPAEALVRASKDAEMLVIGTRGLGGFVGMLLGSVAQQCIQHAECPMLILPPKASR